MDCTYIALFYLNFKDGLSALNVVHALKQHHFIQLCPYLSSFMNDRFNKTHFCNIFFSDIITGFSLADILMFATGLSSLPPSGINLRPKLVFQRVSHFPCSRTCVNTTEIPMSVTWEEFQKDMDFGIQNSPVCVKLEHSHIFLLNSLSECINFLASDELKILSRM
uniref:HECT domain-containing protein n=1 Tax=Stegastes partitus TaxID=144197 RepID=A0A3B5B8L7_9TELE